MTRWKQKVVCVQIRRLLFISDMRGDLARIVYPLFVLPNNDLLQGFDHSDLQSTIRQLQWVGETLLYRLVQAEVQAALKFVVTELQALSTIDELYGLLMDVRREFAEFITATFVQQTVAATYDITVQQAFDLQSLRFTLGRLLLAAADGKREHLSLTSVPHGDPPDRESLPTMEKPVPHPVAGSAFHAWTCRDMNYDVSFYPLESRTPSDFEMRLVFGQDYRDVDGLRWSLDELLHLLYIKQQEIDFLWQTLADEQRLHDEQLGFLLQKVRMSHQEVVQILSGKQSAKKVTVTSRGLSRFAPRKKSSVVSAPVYGPQCDEDLDRSMALLKQRVIDHLRNKIIHLSVNKNFVAWDNMTQCKQKVVRLDV
ncbi:hypothetical protein CBR_g52312 [Chara braunii]|uniref:Uncharacterized protein n=1 Tax=Chara braunii TaxID=69332 RepID=A0A388K6Q7_CHABU|nr:hypothetical protein CBR_g52312 [Chara braunii]|eukprot:GBG65717.1 hypothetical protein CBR_g52312 [Chara braunii]